MNQSPAKVGAQEGPLTARGVRFAYHYAPLHYLPHLIRRGALLSKLRLREEGFNDSHFRSTSHRQDIQRGFARFVHLALDPFPPILEAKLAAGFPHFEVAVPAVLVERTGYLLCRFNIAKTRYFKGALQQPLESDENGRYYDAMSLPVAKTDAERTKLLELNYGRRMIEVLVPDELPLGKECALTFFDNEDFALAKQITDKLNPHAMIVDKHSTISYCVNPGHRRSITEYIKRAVTEPTWRGSRLEFDRV